MRSVLIVVTALIAAVICGSGPDLTSVTAAGQKNKIYIRTETFPRPPYSGATYYIYERDGETICTKLEVCNKYDDCSRTYEKGTFKEDVDIETGEPYGKTDAVLIPSNKLRKHVCLVRFKLL
jgi:hypothetical protein